MSEVTAKNIRIGFGVICRKFLIPTYLFFSYVIMSLIGVSVLAITMLSFFRNGDFISDLSILELAALFWMFFCVRRIYQLSAVGADKLINLLRIFSYSGWLFLWSVLGLYFWFSFFVSKMPRPGFFYSNTIEFYLLFLIVFSFGMAAFFASKPKVLSAIYSDKDSEL